MTVALDLLGRRSWWSSEPQEVMARRLGVSRKTIQRALDRLEELRTLVRQHQPLWSGGRRADLIRIAKHKLGHVIAKARRLAARCAQCPIRTTFPGSKQIVALKNRATGTASRSLLPETRNTAMDQGSLFGRVARRKTDTPTPDNAFTRLQHWRARYRAQYGREPEILKREATLGAIKRWAQYLPTPAHWDAFLSLWLRVSSPAVVQARHPLLWAEKHVLHLIPAVPRELARAERRETEAQWAKDAEARATEAAQRDTQADRAVLAEMAAGARAELARVTTPAPSSAAWTDETTPAHCADMDELLRWAGGYLIGAHLIGGDHE
jgi:hypothetical protein